MTTRGIRNNNPGNIRISNERFQGEVIPSRDRAFKQFQSMEYGYRAIFKLLLTYYNKHGIRTIRGWIGRWAPPHENHTENYIRYVAETAGMDADATIDISDKELFCRIVSGISRMENGVNPRPEEIRRGYELI